MYSAGSTSGSPLDGSTYTYDDDKVYIYVRLYLTGTLTSGSGEVIEYTEDEPYCYEGWLTSQQLREGYMTCPNNRGYDVSIALADAITREYDTTTETILYKVWDDDNNAYGSRGDVTEIEVTPERSEDGVTWEDVLEDQEDPTSEKRTFIIEPPMNDDGTERYTYTLAEMNEDGTYVEDGDSVLVGEEWFQVDIETDDEGNTYFSNSGFPDSRKEVDADGDGLDFGDVNGTQLYWIIALMALAALGAYSDYSDLNRKKKRKEKI